MESDVEEKFVYLERALGALAREEYSRGYQAGKAVGYKDGNAALSWYAHPLRVLVILVPLLLFGITFNIAKEQKQVLLEQHQQITQLLKGETQ